MIEIKITTMRHKIGQTTVVDPIVHHEGRSLICHNLPVSLTKLIPQAWGNSEVASWQPFVERAILLGLL